MRSRMLMAALSLVVLGAPHAAAATTEQKFGYSPDSFEIKFYMQPRYNYALAGGNADANGFSVRRARFYLTATAAPSLKGRLQVSAVTDKVEVLDAYVEWTPWKAKVPALSFTMGNFKKPFSYQEFVMPSSDLNLIDRPHANGLLEKSLFASSYDMGVMATANFKDAEVPVLLNLAVVNGNGAGNKTDSNVGKQIVARGEATPVAGLTVGANATLNRLVAFTKSGADTVEKGESYLVWGADARYQMGNLLVMGEVFGGDFYASVATPASARKRPDYSVPTFLGVYAEAIYRTAGGWEPAARVEKFDPDTDSDDDGLLLLTAGIAKVFSPNFRWQVNLVHTEYEVAGTDADDEIVSQWTVKL